MEKQLSLSKVRIDGGTQSRVGIDDDTVMEYAEVIAAGEQLPPIEVVFDGVDYWLADGFHRYHAHRIAKRNVIAAKVSEGTKREALLRAVGANTKHGLRRTIADKRRAVLTMLSDPEWSAWSDRHIAAHCGVSHTFVSQLRQAMNEPDDASGGNVATSESAPDASDARKTSASSDRSGGNVATRDEVESGREGGNVATLVPASRLDELERELAEARDRIAMLERELAAATRDNELLARQVEATDVAAELVAQNAELRRQNADLQARIEGLMAERDHAIRAAKRAQRLAKASVS